MKSWGTAVCLLLGLCGVSHGDVHVNSEWVLPLRLEGAVGNLPYERTQPVVVGDILFIASLSGKVSAIHRKHGYALWTHQLQAGVEGALAYGRSKIFVGDRAGNFYGLNARDGSEAWRVHVPSEWLSAPVVAKDRVFAVSSNEEVHAFGAEDGAVLWRLPARRGDEKMTIRGTSSPVAADDQVYVGFADGSLGAFSGRNGRELWTKRLRSRDRFYDVDMPPVVDGDSVYAASFDGNFYKLNRATGETRWTFPVGSYGGFLVEEGRVYFSGLNGFLYALDSKSGQPLWKAPIGEGVGLAPVRVGDNLVVTTSADPFYVVDAKEGKVLWVGRLGKGTLAPAAVGEDQWFYCMSNVGNLYSFSLANVPAAQSASPATVALPSAVKREGWL